MTQRPLLASKTALFAAAALALLGGLVAAGCSQSGRESHVSPCASTLTCGAPCSSTTPCSAGQYCNASQVCTAECTATDGNCGSGQVCTSFGRCVSGGTDPGVDPGAVEGGLPEYPDACVRLDVKLTPQLTVLMLIDQSGSMNEQFGNGARWNVLRDALIDMNTGIISTLQAKVRFGLALYTSEGGFGSGTPPKTCPMLTEVAPALNNYAAITAKYLPDDWKGDTPTGESIEAAVKMLDAVSDPGPKVLVLATDGEPDSCADPNPGDAKGHDAARQLSVTAVQNAFQKQISTFVISVGTEVGKDHLRAVANAGQGLAVDVDMTDRFYLTNNQAELAKAFDTIVGGVRSCVFTLNGRVDDMRADTGTVLLDGKPLVYKDKDGWLMMSPTVLEIQGAACTTFKSNGDHDLNIDFPCGVIVPSVQ